MITDETKDVQVETTSKAEPKERKEGELNQRMRRVTDAGVELFGGVAEAVASGIRAFGREMPTDKADLTDWGKSVVQGMAEGSAKLFGELPTVTRKALDILLEDDNED